LIFKDKLGGEREGSTSATKHLNIKGYFGALFEVTPKYAPTLGAEETICAENSAHNLRI
jgi:hypothetical protein